jgi:hypothetical protein
MMEARHTLQYGHRFDSERGFSCYKQYAVIRMLSRCHAIVLRVHVEFACRKVFIIKVGWFHIQHCADTSNNGREVSLSVVPSKEIVRAFFEWPGVRSALGAIFPTPEALIAQW